LLKDVSLFLGGAMAQAISNLVATYGAWTVAGTVVCAGAAIEMAIRTIADVGALLRRGVDRQAVLKNLSADLGGAIFYGLCAVHILPSTAIIGAAIFTIYSIGACDNQDAYYTSQLIGKPIQWLGDNVVMPVINKIVWPILKTIGEIIGNIIDGIGTIMGNCLRAITLPDNPIWLAVGALGAAVLVVKVVIPALAAF